MSELEMAYNIGWMTGFFSCVFAWVIGWAVGTYFPRLTKTAPKDR